MDARGCNFLVRLVVACNVLVRASVANPTFAHAVAVIAKHSGLFERYVDDKENLVECINFLNRCGIWIDPLDIYDNRPFKEVDSARIIGQIHLLFAGEASLERGRITLPSGYGSWREFCDLSGLDYREAFKAIEIFGKNND